MPKRKDGHEPAACIAVSMIVHLGSDTIDCSDCHMLPIPDIYNEGHWSLDTNDWKSMSHTITNFANKWNTFAFIEGRKEPVEQVNDTVGL